MLTKSNASAYAVLAIVADLMTEDEWKNTHVDPYLNGRENGFAVYGFWGDKTTRKFVFSEFRRSDEIVVYEGGPHDFQLNGNSLTDEIYANGRHFNNGHYCAAATYIVEKMRKSVGL